MLIFQLLRSALCEALAQVQACAALLYLQQQAAAAAEGTAAGAAAQGLLLDAQDAAGAAGLSAAGPAGAAGSMGAHGPGAAAAGEEEESLFQRADRLVTASLAGVSAAFRQLEASVHATLDAQQGPAAPPAQDRAVLQGALTRVLGLGHLRRVFSRLQLQQGGGGGGAAGAGGAVVAPGAAAAAAGAAGGQASEPEAAVGPLSGVSALAEARRTVGCTPLLVNASVHSALQAAQRSARSMRARRIIQVRQLAPLQSQSQACSFCGAPMNAARPCILAFAAGARRTLPDLSCAGWHRLTCKEHMPAGRWLTTSQLDGLVCLPPCSRCRTGLSCRRSCSGTGSATPWLA